MKAWIAIVALAVVPVAGARQLSWATAANKICVAYTAKAKQQLGTKPTTTAQVVAWTKKARALEAAELAALSKIPGRTPAAVKALASLRTDVAEIDAALAAWKRGDGAAFVRAFTKWQNDHRPKAAFAAAGATSCG